MTKSHTKLTCPEIQKILIFVEKMYCILGYDVPKMALHRYVDIDDKKSLKELNDYVVTAACYHFNTWKVSQNLIF